MVVDTCEQLHFCLSKAYAETHKASHFKLSFRHAPAPLAASLLTAIALYLLSGLSRSHSNFLLNALRIIVIATCSLLAGQATMTLSGQVPPNIPSSIKGLHNSDNWPRDIRTALQAFDLDPDTMHYACCKKCFSIYPPESKENPRYPKFCTFRETPGSPKCGVKLLQSKVKGEGVIPIRRYVYQPMKSWLGRLLSRPDLEEVMLPPVKPGIFPKMKDIWHGSAFNNFEGGWFFKAPDDELRLCFSLFIDWFNPFGRKRGGRSASVGAIYMVCMNLPVHLRYRVENVYLVGMIPGPHEPSHHHLNHLIRPLINELLQFWKTGVFFSRTAKYPFGRLVKCVLIPVICDLVAMRKTMGFMGVTAHELCSICKLQRKDIANFDIESWLMRSWEEHKKHASAWNEAATEEERDEIFAESRVRWTELLRLPYWDIIKFATVDTMHNFFEGEVKRHIIEIWGMSSVATDPSLSRIQPHSPEQQTDSLYRIAQAVGRHSVDRVCQSGNRVGYIVAMAKLNEIKPSMEKPVKRDWADALVQWVSVNPLPITIFSLCAFSADITSRSDTQNPKGASGAMYRFS
jgi:hypothetical protein